MENNQNQNQNDNHKNDRRRWVLTLAMSLITMLMFAGLMNMAGKANKEEVTYDKFIEMLDSGQVGEVILGSNRITILPKTSLPQNELM